MRTRTTLIAVGSVALAAVGLATVIGPSEQLVRRSTGSDQPVLTARLACPSAGGVSGSTDMIAVTALPPEAAPTLGSAIRASADAEKKPVTVAPFTGDPQAPALITLDARGSVTAANPTGEEPRGWLAATSGALAPGLVAEASTFANNAERRGLADASCTTPVSDIWFVGASGRVGHRARLVINNPADAAALVDVEVWDEKGPVNAPAAQEMGIDARSQKALLLDALAPESNRLAVHVAARKGQVTAGIQSYETEGTDPRGQSFIPPHGSGPAKHLVVPGVPGSGDRTLMIAAPGARDAIVSLRVLGPGGPFAPAANPVVTVPAGTVFEVPAGDAVGADPAAIELSSDQPVVAGLRTVMPSEEGSPDFAYTAATEPLDRLGATLGARTTDSVATDLFLTASGKDNAKATLELLDPSGAVVARSEISVPAGSTKVERIAPPQSGDRQTLVVRPERPGTLSVVRLISGTDGDHALLDLLPLSDVPVTVRVPDVAENLLTGMT
jgi:Family of unknown function (DUF5719)